MNRRNDSFLCRKYPNLFADRGRPMTETAMCWGFQCGDGWYKIIKEAASRLEPLVLKAKTEDPGGWAFGYYRASTVKEKFGTLSFYMTGETKEMSAIIDKAQSQSAKTCEECGKPGKLRGRGWLYTACAKHTKQK